MFVFYLTLYYLKCLIKICSVECEITVLYSKLDLGRPQIMVRPSPLWMTVAGGHLQKNKTLQFTFSHSFESHVFCSWTGQRQHSKCQAGTLTSQKDTGKIPPYLSGPDRKGPIALNYTTSHWHSTCYVSLYVLVVPF